MRIDSKYTGSEKLVCYAQVKHRFPAENLNFWSVHKTLHWAGRSRIHPVYTRTIPENGTLISDAEFNKIIHLDDNFLYSNIKHA